MTTCSLCGADGAKEHSVAACEETVALCPTCLNGVTEGPSDAPHWQCLNDAIWSSDPGVQILAYRLLRGLPEAPWARNLLEIAYLDPDVLAAAEAGLSVLPDLVHRDSNGTVLSQGDTVVLIKDLPVKGAGFTAKRGTAVRGISLVPDNDGHIEGRVDGQRIVILTQFVKKN